MARARPAPQRLGERLVRAGLVRRPDRDRLPQRARAAGRAAATGRLTCRALRGRRIWPCSPGPEPGHGPDQGALAGARIRPSPGSSRPRATLTMSAPSIMKTPFCCVKRHRSGRCRANRPGCRRAPRCARGLRGRSSRRASSRTAVSSRTRWAEASHSASRMALSTSQFRAIWTWARRSAICISSPRPDFALRGISGRRAAAARPARAPNCR